MSQRTRRRRGRDIHLEKLAAPGRGTPWRLLSSPLPRRRLPRPPSNAWSRLRVLPPWPPASVVHPTPDVRESEQRFAASLGSGSFVLSQPEPLLPREHSVNPSLFVRSRRVQGRERLRQFPEPGILADAVIDQESLQGVGSAAGEQEHGLVDPVEYGLRGCVFWRVRIVGRDIGPGFALHRRLRAEPLLFMNAECPLTSGRTFRLAG